MYTLYINNTMYAVSKSHKKIIQFIKQRNIYTINCIIIKTDIKCNIEDMKLKYYKYNIGNTDIEILSTYDEYKYVKRFSQDIINTVFYGNIVKYNKIYKLLKKEYINSLIKLKYTYISDNIFNKICNDNIGCDEISILMYYFKNIINRK